ncbi:MAG: hypothetical protein K2I94_04120, partial [Muribaculaceae bacterium]|nr:hypothetical protein [Muribaculaceae bacterium]
VVNEPYPVMSYRQAMLEFCTYKPDLRNPLIIIDLTDFFQKCTFKPFLGRTVRAIKVSAEMSKARLLMLFDNGKSNARRERWAGGVIL